jgi:hypothetical protein
MKDKYILLGFIIYMLILILTVEQSTTTVPYKGEKVILETTVFQSEIINIQARGRELT